MSLILNIDTATETAHVSFAKDGTLLGSMKNELQKDHGSFLQPAIQRLCKELAIQLNDINAVAVTGGPGSYTGIRVGLASAKGLVFALGKPLIMLNTLEVLTASAFSVDGGFQSGAAILYCPMIDARRMEVFTAIYDDQLAVRLAPCAMVLDEHSFQDMMKENPICFFGNGSIKWSALCKDPNASFLHVDIQAEAMSKLSFKAFSSKDFADPAYSEPFYLKEHQTVTKR